MKQREVSVRRGIGILMVLLGLAVGMARPAHTLTPVSEEWVARHNGPGNGLDYPYGIEVGPDGSVYASGRSLGSGTDEDYATVKYALDGSLLWERRFDGADSIDIGWGGLALGADASVYITGTSNGGGTWFDFATVKYAADGTELWVRRYNGPANHYDDAQALAVGPDGSVYVTGASWGAFTDTGSDFATVKYAADGTEQWVRRYNGPANNTDTAFALAVGADGSVCVTGKSVGVSGADDYATVKYKADGTELWVRRYDGPGNGTDHAGAVAVSADGSVYVTGSSLGNGTEADYATVKYAANGTEVWVRRYNGPGNSNDGAGALVVGADGSVYVTGGSTGDAGGGDYATVKYAADGTELWVRRYNGPGNSNDGAGALVVGVDGSAYVTGGSSGGAGGADYATVKYAADGSELWVQRYNGPGNNNDQALALALALDGSVYVTGYSEGIGTGPDYTTVKYSQPPPDTTSPTISALAVGTIGASNGLPYLPVKVTDTGCGVSKVQLTSNSRNCHLEYPLGTRLVPTGTAPAHNLVLPNALETVTVYAVKDTNAKAVVEVRAWDAAGNTALADPVIANLKIKNGQRLAQTFNGIPAAEHYITLQNGAPGLSSAMLWVNGQPVWRGSLEFKQVVTLNVAAQMRHGTRNHVRIIGTGPKGATAVLLIGDASLAGAGMAGVAHQQDSAQSANPVFGF